MMDLRIKSRTDRINLEMIRRMDVEGLDTTWVNRREFLRGVRDDLLKNVATLSEENKLILVEVNKMIGLLSDKISSQTETSRARPTHTKSW